VHLVRFVIRIYHDARSPEGQKPCKEFVCRGNDAQQRCFKNADIKELNVMWKYNWNLWIDMDEWSAEFNARLKQEHQNVLLFLDIVTCYLRAEAFKVQLVCLPPSTSVTLPRNEDVIDWIMLNISTFHMRSLLASMEISLLQQTCLLCLCAGCSNVTVRGNKTNATKKISPAFPRSRIFCEWFERKSVRLKMCRRTFSLRILLMLKQAAIQEKDEFTESHQQACGEEKRWERRRRRRRRRRKNLPRTTGRMQPDTSLRCCRKHEGS